MRLVLLSAVRHAKGYRQFHSSNVGNNATISSLTRAVGPSRSKARPTAVAAHQTEDQTTAILNVVHNHGAESINVWIDSKGASAKKKKKADASVVIMIKSSSWIDTEQIPDRLQMSLIFMIASSSLWWV